MIYDCSIFFGASHWCLLTKNDHKLYIVNNYPMAKKINRFITSRINKPMKGEVPPSLFIDLRSERDKSVYFCLVMGWLFTL